MALAFNLEEFLALLITEFQKDLKLFILFDLGVVCRTDQDDSTGDIILFVICVVRDF